MRRKEHAIDKSDIELNDWEFRLILGDSWDKKDLLLESIFCSCGDPEKKLVDFKVYLIELNDLVLRGKCSKCNSIAARYIETGEQPESYIVAERIRKMKARG